MMDTGCPKNEKNGHWMSKIHGGFNLNILIYDDEEIKYMTGEIKRLETNPILAECTNINDFTRKYMTTGRKEMLCDIRDYDEKETIRLDDTLMRRIAKYNKEAEIEDMDRKLKAKEERIKQLEEKIEDREERWKKIQKFVAKIYELPIDDENYDYDEY